MTPNQINIYVFVHQGKYANTHLLHVLAHGIICLQMSWKGSGDAFVPTNEDTVHAFGLTDLHSEKFHDCLMFLISRFLYVQIAGFLDSWISTFLDSGMSATR